MSKYSKQEIIKGIISFDKELYKYLDTMYRKKVIGHVLRNSGTREDGEDLYQDVVFEIYLTIKRDRYNADGRGTFEGYFWTITKRRWIDKLRKQKLDIEPLPNEDDIPYEPEEAEYLKNQRILVIRKYLEQLLPDEQEYIRMYYIAKQSIQTIADYFGTTYGGAQQKLHEIRKKLRQMIANDPEFGTSLF